MTDPKILVVIPPQSADAVPVILGAGATPVIDLEAGECEVLPSGAWVRIQPNQSVPNGAAGVLHNQAGSPTKGVPNWLESATDGAPPEGFQGRILRGLRGHANPVATSTDLLASSTSGVELSALPSEIAEGSLTDRVVVLKDVILSLPEITLGPACTELLSKLDPNRCRRVNNYGLLASPVSSVVRRLNSGESADSLASGWSDADRPTEVAWPAGSGILNAPVLAQTYRTLSTALQAYRRALTPASKETSSMRDAPESEDPSKDAIAIVGLGCILPDAPSIDSFWTNIVEGRNCISEVPLDRWDPDLFWSSDRKEDDKTYAKIGGFIRDFKFNSKQFRIPPMVAKQVDVVQQLALQATGQALDDAGIGPDGRTDLSRVAVILGNSMG